MTGPIDALCYVRSLAAMISTGQRLNLDFKVKIVRTGRREALTFASLLKRPTVVSVYMRNNTPSCDRQVEELVTAHTEIDRLGYELIALSRDTCGSHEKYSAKRALTYTLCSDPEDHFARAADALIEKSMYGRSFIGPARAAFVLSADATVLAVIEKVDTKTHAAQLLAVLRSLNAG